MGNKGLYTIRKVIKTVEKISFVLEVVQCCWVVKSAKNRQKYVQNSQNITKNNKSNFTNMLKMALIALFEAKILTRGGSAYIV